MHAYIQEAYRMFAPIHTCIHTYINTHKLLCMHIYREAIAFFLQYKTMWYACSGHTYIHTHVLLCREAIAFLLPYNTMWDTRSWYYSQYIMCVLCAVCIHVCMHLCECICMYIYMYVCMYVCVCVFAVHNVLSLCGMYTCMHAFM